MGPKDIRSIVLSVEQESACIAFRRHTLLPLDDCLYAPQSSIPLLMRSLLHRLFQRHGMPSFDESKYEPLPEVESNLKDEFWVDPSEPLEALLDLT